MGWRTHQRDHEVSLLDPHTLPPCTRQKFTHSALGPLTFLLCWVCSRLFSQQSLSLDPVPGTQPGNKGR